MFIEDMPATVHPLAPSEDGERLVADPSVSVEVFQLRPDRIAAAAQWLRQHDLDCERLASGGLLVARGDDLLARWPLGDWARLDDNRLRIEPADGFFQRWQPEGVAVPAGTLGEPEPAAGE